MFYLETDFLLLILAFIFVSVVAFAQQEEYQKKVYVSPENDTPRIVTGKQIGRAHV